MAGSIDIYGIGNAIVDLQVRATDEELARFGVAKATMRLIDEGERQKLVEYFGPRSLHQTSGGSGANTAIAAAQLGSKTAFSAVVGGDDLGRFYQKEMEEIGVKFHTTPRLERATGTSLILITPDAERTMNTFLGATAEFGTHDVSHEILSHSKWLFIEGYLFSSETGRSAVAEAIAGAKQHGVKIALTLSDVFIVEGFRDAVRAAVKEADLLFANAAEARAFTGEASEEEAFTQLKVTVQNVVMTRSEKGAWLRVRGEEHRIEAFPTKAIDDTGAGDMFAGAFLHGLVQGYPPLVCARTACYLASRVVSQLGARLHGDVLRLLEDAHQGTVA